MQFKEVVDGVLDRLSHMPQFCDLVFVYVFGSQVEGKAHPDSDVDVCLYFDLPREDLSRLEVELPSKIPDKVDISLFQLMPLHIRANVFKGELVYYKDKKKVYDIAIDTFKQYSLYKPLYLQVIH